MIQDLTISIVQADQIWEDKSANLKNYDRLLESISPSDLILLPEMFNTAFSMNAGELAEEMHSSSSLDWLKATAAKHNSAVYTSMIVQENGEFFNRGLFVLPDGEFQVYDKRKTFGLAGEDTVFSKGTKENIVHYKGWNIQLQICYDLRFPEISLNRMENGNPAYDLMLYVANWPERRSQHWKNLLPARAIENQCYLAAVNRVGTDKMGLTYSGDSTLLDLHGNRLVEIVHEEKVETVVLSYSGLQEMRAKLPFLKDRAL